MPKTDSRLSKARVLAAQPRPLDSAAAVVAAAAFFAVTALALAAMVIAMPPHWG